MYIRWAILSTCWIYSNKFVQFQRCPGGLKGIKLKITRHLLTQNIKVVKTAPYLQVNKLIYKTEPGELKIQESKGLSEQNEDHSIYVNVTGVRKRLNPVINYCQS